VSLLEAKAASAACQKQHVLLLEPPADTVSVPLDPATGIRKPSSSIADLQQLIVEVWSQCVLVLLACLDKSKDLLLLYVSCSVIHSFISLVFW
jgi:hypothetical protein